jgi:transaldolase
MATSLDQLKKFTIVVSDTGDFEQIAKYKPQDATTNPSLIFTASQLPQYQKFVEEAVKYGKEKGGSDHAKQAELAMDRLAVLFGLEILKIIPGRVSTEIDARLSFDTEGTIKKAREIVALYKEAGIDYEKRVLVKIASTWEGLQAAKVLEAEGIHVNMTLLFSLTQAIVSAENGVTLISPFAGRITDFYKAKEGRKDNYPAHEDPGVVSIQHIYNYLKKYGYKTVVMGASFRTKEQIIELAGCDLLTVAPTLLAELQQSTIEITQKLDASKAAERCTLPKQSITQSRFLWDLNNDEMAHFKLAEGIRKFSDDLIKLEKDVLKRLQA